MDQIKQSVNEFKEMIASIDKQKNKKIEEIKVSVQENDKFIQDMIKGINEYN